MYYTTNIYAYLRIKKATGLIQKLNYDVPLNRFVHSILCFPIKEVTIIKINKNQKPIYLLY